MNRKSRARTILVVSAVWVVTIGCIEAPPVEDRRVLGAGFRYSAYGPDHNPGPSYWSRVGREMAARFEGSVPETIWIVSSLDGDGTRLHFPVAEPQRIEGGRYTMNGPWAKRTVCCWLFAVAILGITVSDAFAQQQPSPSPSPSSRKDSRSRPGTSMPSMVRWRFQPSAAWLTWKNSTSAMFP